MPKHCVEAVGRYIDEPVIEFQRNLDLWMLQQEPTQRGPEMQSSKTHWR